MCSLLVKVVTPEVVATSPFAGKSREPVYCGLGVKKFPTERAPASVLSCISLIQRGGPLNAHSHEWMPLPRRRVGSTTPASLFALHLPWSNVSRVTRDAPTGLLRAGLLGWPKFLAVSAARMIL